MLLLVNSLLFSLCFYQEIAADESLVKKAGTYLVDVVLPKFVQDLSSLEVSPMDGQNTWPLQNKNPHHDISGRNTSRTLRENKVRESCNPF